ncbi:hypothetical protein NP233_g183 [Leucocoprinus birnbaumii]|uniref:Uncharacterized protein n=1 Tax=Leucocoprinus birnbaumii TaxID=56174 RepID=A0AAD5W2U5_9AGAR|nr:hypothetical protein NP233_g183 [Leucocoprinus birnbaumii]
MIIGLIATGSIWTARSCHNLYAPESEGEGEQATPQSQPQSQQPPPPQQPASNEQSDAYLTRQTPTKSQTKPTTCAEFPAASTTSTTRKLPSSTIESTARTETMSSTQTQKTSQSKAKGLQGPLKDIDAFIFDVFGTVVDWRTNVVKEVTELGKKHSSDPAVNWAQFAPEWRNAYMNSVLSIGGGSATSNSYNIDVVHRQLLDQLIVKPEWAPHTSAWTEEEKHELTYAWHRLNGMFSSKLIIAYLSAIRKHCVEARNVNLSSRFRVLLEVGPQKLPGKRISRSIKPDFANLSFSLTKLLPTAMRNLARLLPLVIFAASIAAQNSTRILAPNTILEPATPANNTLSLDGTDTDADTIVSTVQIVDQKAGAPVDAPPDPPVPPVTITAVDGQLTNATVPTSNNTATRRSVDLSKRLLDGYDVVFEGTGTGLTDRDGSIQGTAYLTFTVVSNSTYNVDDCLKFCSGVQGCVFANLYYELNNPGLDWSSNPGSNLKCAVYGDVHTAAEKTNMGGQQLEPLPYPLVYIQNSSGYASTTLVDPPAPEGYELTFGPTGGANNAPGYMGFAFIDRYDVDACAQLCNTRGPDGNGGACQYFNIWRAVVNGNPTTYTCSFYYLVSDASTANNFGQGDLKVTYSRGYKRKTLIQDGGFENYAACDASDVCWTESTQFWSATSPPGGNLDAEIIHHAGFAHSGNSAALLGSGFGTDSLAGTIAPTYTLDTVPGATYLITFFHSSAFNGDADAEANAFVDVLWNGKVAETIRPGFSDWKYFELRVVATGNDKLAFHGGAAPAWSFIDDVFVFLA